MMSSSLKLNLLMQQLYWRMFTLELISNLDQQIFKFQGLIEKKEIVFYNKTTLIDVAPKAMFPIHVFFLYMKLCVGDKPTSSRLA